MPSHTTYTIRWTDVAWEHEHRRTTDKRYQHLISLSGEECDATMQSIVAGLHAIEAKDIKVTREMSVEDDVTPPAPSLLSPSPDARLAESAIPEDRYVPWDPTQD